MLFNDFTIQKIRIFHFPEKFAQKHQTNQRVATSDSKINKNNTITELKNRIVFSFLLFFLDFEKKIQKKKKSKQFKKIQNISSLLKN